MPLTEQDIVEERRRLAQRALDLVGERGELISIAHLAADSGYSLRRMEQIFATDDEAFDAVAELWFEPKIAAMEDVLATDLPPNRKMYEFFARRYVIQRDLYLEDPKTFTLICELGAARFERVRSYVDLADHYLCELIAQAQADGFFSGMEIDETLSLINQMVNSYIMPDALLYVHEKLSEDKLARIIDTIFAGLSGEDKGSRGVNTIRVAS